MVRHRRFWYDTEDEDRDKEGRGVFSDHSHTGRTGRRGFISQVWPETVRGTNNLVQLLPSAFPKTSETLGVRGDRGSIQE